MFRPYLPSLPMVFAALAPQAACRTANAAGEAVATADSRLSLNCSKPVQPTWNQDRPGFIRKADADWMRQKHAADEKPGDTKAK